MDGLLNIPVECNILTWSLPTVNANPTQDWFFTLKNYPNDYGMMDLSPN